MATIERPGINPKWLKRMKTWHKGNQKKWYESTLLGEQGQMGRYVEHGVCMFWDGKSPPPANTHGRFVDTLMSLANLGDLYEYAFESRSMVNGRFEAEAARETCAAHYLSRIVDMSRNTGLNFGQTNITALAYLLGWKAQALMLTRAWLAYWREIVIDTSDRDEINLWPFTTFRQSLLAEHFGLAPYIPESVPLKEPILVALLRHWRDPDPETIAPLCLAALDLHTHSAVGALDDGDDFADGHFAYMPIDILLLFKLRQELGLANPVLDHPLMSGPFAALPEEIPFAYNDLLQRVIERMCRDGFNEEKIIADSILLKREAATA